MTRRKTLPEDLRPQARRLVVRMRELKDQAGMSTLALARQTSYSASSWNRYLNGTALPPRRAVERMSGLVGLSGVDTARLLALWELAEHEQPQAERQLAEAEEPTTDLVHAAPGSRRRQWMWISAAALGIAAGGAVLGVAVWRATTTADPPSPSTVAASAPPTGGYACEYTTRDGRLYAGHSAVTARLVALNATGQDVVEIQCLLKHHDIDPGQIDGLYGERTEQAVKQLQSASGAPADGKVGPRTWALLRR